MTAGPQWSLQVWQGCLHDKRVVCTSNLAFDREEYLGLRE